MKALLVASVLFVASCNFAVKHPAATAGIVAGSVALVTCELASEDHKTCPIAAGAVGLGLALVAAGALWLGSEDEPEPTKDETPQKVDWSKVPDTTPKEPTKAPPAVTPPPATPPPIAPTTPPTPPTTPPPSEPPPATTPPATPPTTTPPAPTPTP